MLTFSGPFRLAEAGMADIVLQMATLWGNLVAKGDKG